MSDREAFELALERFLDGTLSSKERPAFLEILRREPECRAEFVSAVSQEALLRSVHQRSTTQSGRFEAREILAAAEQVNATDSSGHLPLAAEIAQHRRRRASRRYSVRTRARAPSRVNPWLPMSVACAAMLLLAALVAVQARTVPRGESSARETEGRIQSFPAPARGPMASRSKDEDRRMAQQQGRDDEQPYTPVEPAAAWAEHFTAQEEELVEIPDAHASQTVVEEVASDSRAPETVPAIPQKESEPPAAREAPQGPVLAKVVLLEGAEAVSSSLHGQQTKVSSGFLLRENSAIEVSAAPEAPGENARLILELNDGSRLALQPGSELQVGSEQGAFRASLKRGQLHARMQPQPARRAAVFRTTHGPDVAVFHGVFSLGVDSKTMSVRLNVEEGLAYFRSVGLIQTVSAGQSSTATAHHAPAPPKPAGAQAAEGAAGDPDSGDAQGGGPGSGAGKGPAGGKGSTAGGGAGGSGGSKGGGSGGSKGGGSGSKGGGAGKGSGKGPPAGKGAGSGKGSSGKGF